MNDAQNQADFQLARAAASNVHQKALDAAQSAFEDQHAFIKEKHAAHYVKCRDNFDQRKFDPEDRQHDEAKRDFHAAANTPADYRLALHELDRATRAADAAFHDTMNKLAAKHGIGAAPAYWRAE